ncbi:hypothetical protein QFC24_000792 [Naganishia onofrii]|uniref:Uncharacterized protein n=1 Tax=Naganishia onofrii TaxID=1851511 RepID=A0ACC2XUU9_9TREE|nr:hypothetical protein QFC24_000792 [Naganishia onofrii]
MKPPNGKTRSIASVAATTLRPCTSALAMDDSASEGGSDTSETPDIDDVASTAGGPDDTNEPTSAEPEVPVGVPAVTSDKAADRDPSTAIPINPSKKVQQTAPLNSDRRTAMPTAPPSPGITTRTRSDSVMSGQTAGSTEKQYHTPSSNESATTSQVPTTPDSSASSPPSPSTESAVQSSGVSTQDSLGVPSTGGNVRVERPAVLPPLPPPALQTVEQLFKYLTMLNHYNDGETIVGLLRRLTGIAAAWERQREANKTESDKLKEEKEAPKLRDEKMDKDKWNEFLLIVRKDPATARLFSGLDTEAQDDIDGEKTPEGSLSPSTASQAGTASTGSASSGDQDSSKRSVSDGEGDRASTTAAPKPVAGRNALARFQRNILGRLRAWIVSYIDYCLSFQPWV